MSNTHNPDRRRILLGAAASTCLPMASQAQKMDDVIVVGAGLSGLRSALMLEEAGLKVTVLEGRDRIGGRLYTLDTVPGKPEAGGNEIGSSYGRVLYTMQRYGVTAAPMRPRTESIQDHTCMNLQGETILLKDWAKHPNNPFPPEYRDTLPWHLEFNAFSAANPLSIPKQFIEAEYAKFDISLYDFLKRQGFSERAIELGASTNLGHGHSAKEVSLLMWFNILAFVNLSRGGDGPQHSVAVAGGNQRLPEAMARALKTEVRLGAGVAGISSEQDHASVTLGDGSKLSAKHIIVTAPFKALRSIKLDAPLTTEQRSAINTLDYTRSTQLHYRATRKFWELDGLPPSMWTDSKVARFLALRNNPGDPDEITSFVVYANDNTALQLDRLSEHDANRSVLQHLNKIRPSTKDALEFVQSVSWQKDPFAGGAYAVWQPGQITEFGNSFAKPAGRIHFAGAHTSIETRGMEAAMQSAERVVYEVTQKM